MDAAIRASARDPTDTRPARAAWRRPRRWPRFLEIMDARAVPASVLILSCTRHSHAPARLVKVTHLAQQVEQVVPPAFALTPHLDAVGEDGDPARHPARKLVHVEVALRVDADDYVVPVCDHAPQAQPLPTQLDPKRVGEVVQLRGAGPVAVFERPEHRLERLLAVGGGELPVGSE